jgi:hypothetical protein
MKKKVVFKAVLLLSLVIFVCSSSIVGCANSSANQNGNTSQNSPTVSSNNPSNTPIPTAQPSPTAPPVEHVAAPENLHALYLTGWTVGITSRLNHFIDLTKKSIINSFVVDIKDDDGYVGYKSSVPAVKQYKAWESKYNVDKVIKALHKNNIHVIGRIVCFKDPILSSKRPDLAIKNVNGGLWRDRNGLTWLNPYNEDSWPYLINIAKEAVKKGFDEIQFDYVRFANDGDKRLMYFGTSKLKKYQVIDNFLAYAKKELSGVTVSADVFGIICESPADTEGIGQYLEHVGKDIDYISPMAYPSHYAVGQIVNKVRFVKPDLKPYSVVYNTLKKAKARISKVNGYTAKIRPYLQDFTASWLGRGYYQQYGPQQVKEQIKAVNDAGLDQWIFWDANNHYDESAFLK